MEENSETHAYMGNWAESLGSIVDKTEQNLYGTGVRPRPGQSGHLNDSNI